MGKGKKQINNNNNISKNIMVEKQKLSALEEKKLIFDKIFSGYTNEREYIKNFKYLEQLLSIKTSDKKDIESKLEKYHENINNIQIALDIKENSILLEFYSNLNYNFIQILNYLMIINLYLRKYYIIKSEGKHKFYKEIIEKYNYYLEKVMGKIENCKFILEKYKNYHYEDYYFYSQYVYQIESYIYSIKYDFNFYTNIENDKVAYYYTKNILRIIINELVSHGLHKENHDEKNLINLEIKAKALFSIIKKETKEPEENLTDKSYRELAKKSKKVLIYEPCDVALIGYILKEKLAKNIYIRLMESREVTVNKIIDFTNNALELLEWAYDCFNNSYCDYNHVFEENDKFNEHNEVIRLLDQCRSTIVILTKSPLYQKELQDRNIVSYREIKSKKTDIYNNIFEKKSETIFHPLLEEQNAQRFTKRLSISYPQISQKLPSTTHTCLLCTVDRDIYNSHATAQEFFNSKNYVNPIKQYTTMLLKYPNSHPYVLSIIYINIAICYRNLFILENSEIEDLDQPNNNSSYPNYYGNMHHYYKLAREKIKETTTIIEKQEDTYISHRAEMQEISEFLEQEYKNFFLMDITIKNNEEFKIPQLNNEHEANEFNKRASSNPSFFINIIKNNVEFSININNSIINKLKKYIDILKIVKKDKFYETFLDLFFTGKATNVYKFLCRNALINNFYPFFTQEEISSPNAALCEILNEHDKNARDNIPSSIAFINACFCWSAIEIVSEKNRLDYNSALQFSEIICISLQENILMPFPIYNSMCLIVKYGLDIFYDLYIFSKDFKEHAYEVAFAYKMVKNFIMHNQNLLQSLMKPFDMQKCVKPFAFFNPPLREEPNLKKQPIFQI